MHRCLEVLEILSRIAGYLTKQEAFRFASTCKAFLEPGLDEVWYHINSFEPLVRCLPEGIWHEQVVVVQLDEGDEEYTMLCLRRYLASEDIARYLSYYAPRIRSFRLDDQSGVRTLSIESLHGVQLVTGSRPGVLSPFLKSFSWYDLTEATVTYGQNYAIQLAAHMFLFLGSGVEKLHASLSDDEPVSFQNAMHAGLEDLTLQFPPPSVIRHLAVLPRLRELEITCLSGDDRPLAVPPDARMSAFPSLRSLTFAGTKLEFAHYFLQYLPPNQGVRSLTWDAIWERESVADWRSFLKALESHSNCFSLRNLKLQSSHYARSKTCSVVPENPEPIEMDPRQIDLKPLFVFGSLQSLSIEVEHSVMVTPSVAAMIPIAWPGLTDLILAPFTANTHPPAIDHTHIVELSQNLPSLRYLGLKFDASSITGEERCIGPPPPLTLLRVGNSPICSPSGIASFLQHNFPALKSLITWRVDKGGDGGMFQQRWEAANRRWREIRRLPMVPYDY